MDVSEFPVLRRNPGYLYIVKTHSLAALFPPHGLDNTRWLLAGPRRFGKTLWVSTMEALFPGRKELFADTWIGQEGHWDRGRNLRAVLRLSPALRGRRADVEQALGRRMGRRTRHPALRYCRLTHNGRISSGFGPSSPRNRLWS